MSELKYCGGVYREFFKFIIGTVYGREKIYIEKKLVDIDSDTQEENKNRVNIRKFN